MRTLGPDARHPLVVGVDGRPEGRDAAALGAALARSTGAEVLLVGVYVDSPFPLPPTMSREELRRHTHDELATVRDEVAPGARIVVEGDLSVARALARAAHREHAGMLVVGSSSKAHEGSTQVGRRTRQLLEHLECPLGVAPRGYARRAERRLHTIVAGFDHTPESGEALALAERIAQLQDGTLSVRTVVADAVAVGALGFTPGLPVLDYTQLHEAAVADARKRLGAATAAIGGRVETDVLSGDPAGRLRGLSREADLIVIGSRHWGAFARVVTGSVGEGVLHGAGCPVIVVPRPEKDAHAGHHAHAA